MNQSTHIANPFYASRLKRVATRNEARDRPVYARLPAAPRNASPVPGLTSLYHSHLAGDYGDRSYPGNCGGNLDPMSGSGTAGDVCKELGIPCLSFDIHDGFDACDPKDFSETQMYDFIWAHPAYWRMKLYADDPRDLSRSPTLEHFLGRYGQFIRNCVRALKPEGKLAILMGDYNDREEGFVPLTFHTKRLAFAAGLRQCCTDIIRFSHGASSSKKVYRSSFIPGLHDTCMVFEKPADQRKGA
jgi:hypothetical protein